MESRELKELINKTLHSLDLDAKDIPDIDLYMDQIINLFDTKLSANKRTEDDKLLTKTMINNYSKEGLMLPAKGKKYTKEHIFQILIILSMKNILSLNDIQRVMQSIMANEGYRENSLNQVYDEFLALKAHARGSVQGVINSVIDVYDLNANNKEDLLLLLLCFTSMADEMKRLAEKMIDTYFE